MGYLHIENLYKDQSILLFKECYAMEKIHGTSAHIGWNSERKSVYFFSGGENYAKFVVLFDIPFLQQKFLEVFPDSNVVIFGEAYGGRQQGMSHTYGKDLKFITFDIKVGDSWLSVTSANILCNEFKLEFVHYRKIDTSLDSLNLERDSDSVQAVRNGVGSGHKREGIVLRPLEEVTKNNGSRIIAKYKSDTFAETKTPRIVNTDKITILADAKAIAEEWVTPMRLEHVLQKFPEDVGLEFTGDIIRAMLEDVYREGKDEFTHPKELNKFIGTRTVQLFKQKLQSKLL